MTVAMTVIEDPQTKFEICRSILESLPLWFGIPESNDEYCDGVRDKYFLSINSDCKHIGFVSLKVNNKYTLEIYVMGILSEYHNKGIGTRLIEEITKYAQINRYEYLEVKTLDESRESEEYRKTRLFYTKVGFKPFDVLYNEWGPDNPCLIMIKDIQR